MEDLKSSIPLLKNQKLPDCYQHKGNELKWVCLEKSCERRLFCDVCVIQDHKNIHKNFTHIYQTLTDPLLSFQNFDVSWNDLVKKRNIREKFEDYIRKEEDKLDELFNNIVMNLSSRFEKIKKQFHEDLHEFLKIKEEIIDSIESHRKDYSEFMNNYFPGIESSSYDQLKETVEIILTRFFSDSEMLNKFKSTQEAIPTIKRNDQYTLKMNNLDLDSIKWTTFTTKGLNLAVGGLNLHSWNRIKTCGDITFSNGDKTVKKNAGNLASTVLGNVEMSDGVHEWKIQINEVVGSYFCVGILKAENNWDVKVDNWASGLCVCSDKNAYGMVKVKGEISLMPNDIIEFQLDLCENKFTINGPGNNFVVEIIGIVHTKYIPFVSYPAFAGTKVSFL